MIGKSGSGKTTLMLILLVKHSFFCAKRSSCTSATFLSA
ncbi:MAG: hypothetical protein QMB65_07180 [Vicingaceae bacterium]